MLPTIVLPYKTIKWLISKNITKCKHKRYFITQNTTARTGSLMRSLYTYFKFRNCTFSTDLGFWLVHQTTFAKQSLFVSLYIKNFLSTRRKKKILEQICNYKIQKDGFKTWCLWWGHYQKGKKRMQILYTSKFGNGMCMAVFVGNFI